MNYYWRIFYYRKHYPSQKQSSQKADLCEAFRILSIKAWQNIGVIFSHTMAYLLYCILDVFIQFYIFPSPALPHIKTQIIQRGSNCVKNVNILWWREETHGSIYSGYWTKQWRSGSPQDTNITLNCWKYFSFSLLDWSPSITYTVLLYYCINSYISQSSAH